MGEQSTGTILPPHQDPMDGSASNVDILKDNDPTDPYPSFVYPHEDIDGLADFNSRQEWIGIAKLLRQNLPVIWRDRKLPKSDRKKQAFELFNSSAGADTLPNKLPFGDIVAELGYQAPRSILIAKGTSAGEIEAAAKSSLSDQVSYFAKPVDGYQGIGASQFDDLNKLAETIEQSPEDYLVQSDETPEEDWRYILHRDIDNPDRVWRIAYKKVRPIVIGDGSSTLAQLVQSSSEIPEDRKSRIIHKIVERADSVPADGQITAVAETGNISQGAYGQLPSTAELERMDDFMRRFVGDLEAMLGSELSTLCFDLGVKDKSVFEGEYDFEKLKAATVFYEFQLPFGISGYLDELYTLNGKSVDTLKNQFRRHRLLYRLGKSVLKNLIAKQE